nr:histidine kinase [Actinopolymorpha pittospori]
MTSILVSELGAVAFYRLGIYARQLRARTVQAETLLVELERSREAQLGAATLAERQRLAREMHDVLAHSLSGLLLHLEGARLLAVRESVDPRLTDTIERARHLAEAGLGEARQAIGMLRDEDLPGPERLRALAGEYSRDSGVRCDLEVSGTPHDLGPQTRLTLYRVAQEALTNVRKHARPDHVEVRLGYEPGGTRLSVEDFTTDAGPADHRGEQNPDNRQLDDERLDDHQLDDRGYGVSGMRERAELLGGTVTAAPTGNGFRVVLWVPGGHG